MKTKAILISTMTAILAFLFVSCSEDDDTSVDVDAENYNTEVYITDAPIDNAEVDAVFITVADVQIDGQSLSGFEKTTIELSALTDGETQLLGDLDLRAKEYDDIDLILATDSDVNGDSPANYVVVDGSTKVALEAPNATINIDGAVEVAAQNTNQIVLDVDLRKAIVADEANGGYNFSSERQLNSSVRVVNTISTGSISGTVTNDTNNQDGVMVAYVYKTDAFTGAEPQENAEGVRFANSVSSSVVAEGSQDFTLHFLEADTYEVHFASYTDTNSDGMLEFDGMVNAEVDGTIPLDSIEVNAGAEVTLTIILQSILPF